GGDSHRRGRAALRGDKPVARPDNRARSRLQRLRRDDATMRELTFTAAAREGLAEEMERDPTVFVMGEGIGERGGNWSTTTGLYERFGPWRLRDTPISERGFTGLCTGAAMVGARLVVDFMFLDFLLDAMGEIINQMSKMQYMSAGRLTMP